MARSPAAHIAALMLALALLGCARGQVVMSGGKFLNLFNGTVNLTFEDGGTLPPLGFMERSGPVSGVVASLDTIPGGDPLFLGQGNAAGISGTTCYIISVVAQTNDIFVVACIAGNGTPKSNFKFYGFANLCITNLLKVCNGTTTSASAFGAIRSIGAAAAK